MKPIWDMPIKTLDEAIQAACHLYISRRYSEAEALCAQILQYHPQQFVALYLYGLVMCRVGDTTTGSKWIEQAFRIQPEIRHYDNRIGLLRQQGCKGSLFVWESLLIEFLKLQTIEQLIISYPKCGRTWLRAMLGRYLLRGRDGNPLEVYSISRTDSELPVINFSHDDFPHLKPYTDLQEDKAMYKHKTVVLLVRDPRDVLVSYYFQYTKRGDKERANDAGFNGTLSDFIRYEIGGSRSLVGFYNIWARNREVPKRFLLLRYEDFQANVRKEFVKLIKFLGLPDLGQAAIDDAVSFGSFDNLRRLEETNALKSFRLEPPKDGDREGYKIRRGVVGGYTDYLNEEDIAFIERFLDAELADDYMFYKRSVQK